MSIFADLNDLQQRVVKWFHLCFGDGKLGDFNKRNSRFFEEAVELVQAGGMSEEEAHALVKHKYSQPPGDLKQEAGGVLTTYLTWITARGFKFEDVARDALLDGYERIEEIRAKIKPDFSKPPVPNPIPTLSSPCRTLLINQGADLIPRSCPTCGIFDKCHLGLTIKPESAYAPKKNV